MSLHTGGRAVGATSTRSRSASCASRREACLHRDDPDRLAGGADEAHLGTPDALIDTWFGADVTSSVTCSSAPGPSRHRTCLKPPGSKQKAPHAVPAGPPDAGIRQVA